MKLRDMAPIEAINIRNDYHGTIGMCCTKVTANKPKLAYTFRSTMECIAAVREYATNGPYKDPDNWKEVKDEDWDQALLRHVMAYLEAKRGNGSVYDELSHIHHLAHVLTTVGFLMENHTVRDGKTIKEAKT